MCVDGYSINRGSLDCYSFLINYFNLHYCEEPSHKHRNESYNVFVLGYYRCIQQGKYPNTFYRVSIKALIKNNKGEILVVKEHQDKWELPGGGLDQGETIHDCLKRELKEELNVTNEFSESFNKNRNTVHVFTAR